MNFPTQHYPLAGPGGARPGVKPPANTPSPVEAATDRQWWTDENNLLRRIGFPLGVFFIFLRFSFIHEIITERVHLNLYLLLVIGGLAILMTIASGGLRRTFGTRAGKYWALFTLWMLLTIPFSSWKSDSGLTVMNFIRVTMPTMLVIAGLTMTLKECFRMMWAIAFAAVLNMLYAKIVAIDGVERLGLTFGSISNPNDFAAHLLLILPFLLWVALSASMPLIRIAAFAFFIFGVFVGASSGSRGAMIGASAVVLFAFLRASGLARLAILVVAPLLAVGLLVFTPDRLLNRYATLFQPDELATSNEAVQSGHARKYLLFTSLGLTLRNPLFGVGPGQFANVEGQAAVDQKKRGLWQVSHNTYTQVSSEGGIPALIFFAAALIVTFLTFDSLYRQCRSQPQLRHLRNASYCLMLSMVGFCTAIFFISLAYSMYLPVMTGLAIALNRAFQHEITAGQRPTALKMIA